MAQREIQAKVVNVRCGQAGTGIPQIALAFRCTVGPEKLRVFKRYFALTDAALEWTIKSLCACGYTGGDLGRLTAADLSADVVLVVDRVQDEHGVFTDEIAFVNSASYLGMKTDLASAAMAKVNDRVAAEMRRQAGGPSAPPAHDPETGEVGR